MAPFATSLVSKTVIIDGQRTTVRLEPAFWAALDDICNERGVSRRELLSTMKPGDGSLTSRLRVMVLDHHRGDRRASA